MTEHRALVLGDAMTRIDDFFDGVFSPLQSWAAELEPRIAAWIDEGRVTGMRLAALVEADAHRILDTTERPLYGAGYCASDAVVSEGNPLAWWQGPERSLLAASTFGPGQAAIDLERLEWYRVPAATGELHIAGPFVDYLCSNEITVTSAVPVRVREQFCGVVCADVLVATLEQVLLPRVSGPAEATLVNLSGRVVVSSDSGYETGDRYAGADPVRGIETLAESLTVVRSVRYPFALVSAV